MNKTEVKRVWLDDSAIWVELNDGRRAKEDFVAYSRLSSSTPSQRKNFRLSHFGIHWPEIDEDLSYDGFFKKQQAEDFSSACLSISW